MKKSIIIITLIIIIGGGLYYLIHQSQDNELTEEEIFEIGYEAVMDQTTVDISDSTDYIKKIKEEKPSLASWSEEEKSEAIAHTEVINKSYERIKGLGVPPKYEEFHLNTLLPSLEKRSQAMTLFREWIENEDEDKLAEHNRLMEETEPALDQAFEDYMKLQLD
jgi:hypothetical protein